MIFETLQKTNLPCAYSHFRDKVDPPYIVYVVSIPSELTIPGIIGTISSKSNTISRRKTKQKKEPSRMYSSQMATTTRSPTMST